MQNNENRLVPGQGRPPDLGKLRKLAYGRPPAAGRSTAPFHSPTPSARPRRFRRAASDWSGVLALGLWLTAVAALVQLDRGGDWRNPARGDATPATRIAMPGAAEFLPDATLGPEDRERYWALAGFEPLRFARLLGVEADDPARMEEDARNPERLHAERSLRR